MGYLGFVPDAPNTFRTVLKNTANILMMLAFFNTHVQFDLSKGDYIYTSITLGRPGCSAISVSDNFGVYPLNSDFPYYGTIDRWSNVSTLTRNHVLFGLKYLVQVQNSPKVEKLYIAPPIGTYIGEVICEEPVFNR